MGILAGRKEINEMRWKSNIESALYYIKASFEQIEEESDVGGRNERDL